MNIVQTYNSAGAGIHTVNVFSLFLANLLGGTTFSCCSRPSHQLSSVYFPLWLITWPVSSLYTCFRFIISPNINPTVSVYPSARLSAMLHSCSFSPVFSCCLLPVCLFVCLPLASGLLVLSAFFVWSPRHNFFSYYWLRKDYFSQTQAQPASSLFHVFFFRVQHSPALTLPHSTQTKCCHRFYL